MIALIPVNCAAVANKMDKITNFGEIKNNFQFPCEGRSCNNGADL
jgi:hypothetical protein